eukprot:CAMPEP_0167776160 /NCGR_PEP_ID=MMETSP0111_2-20121227/2971_1 /TAXON_ID=91324 /ORGANISM="Lotharella globosa, Strain CCCM811" /LENGTH=83 /DNA_ID=CAMNT_0007666177 /DNA_START=9 /DNA_END=260 /DNA_ORIENTATION=+
MPSNAKVAMIIAGAAGFFGLSWGALSFTMHNKQMRRNYDEERRIALENLALGIITKEEFDSLHCNKALAAQRDVSKSSDVDRS